MRRLGTVRRTLQSHNDGQRRWDRVYQHLLEWAPAPTKIEIPRQPAQKEVCDASSFVCSSLDTAPSADPDH